MIQEFLVSISYGERGRDDWQQAFARIDAGVKKLRAELEDLAREAAKAFERITISSAGAEFAAQRCGASAQSLLALTYSLRQVGVGADAMMRAVNGIATKMRTLPNTEGLIRFLGVQTRAGGQLRDNADVLLDILEALGKQDYILAAHNASLLGISERDYAQLRAKAPEIRKGVEDAKALMAGMGVDKDKLGQGSILLMASWRMWTAQVELVLTAIMMSVAPVLQPLIEDLTQWVRDHHAEILDFARRLVEAMAGAARDLKAVIKALAPAWEAFSSFIRAATGADGLVVAFGAIGGAYLANFAIGVVTPLGLILAALLGLTALVASSSSSQARPVGAAAGARGGERPSPLKRMKAWIFGDDGSDGESEGSGGPSGPFEPSPDGASVAELAEERKRFAEELKDPGIAARLAAYTEAETGANGAAAQQAFIESLMNRAAARGQTLREVLAGSFFPAETHSAAARFQGRYVGKYRGAVGRVLGGSNISGYATGNASGDVGFNKGVQTFSSGGERFGVEGPDLKWAARMRERVRRRAEEDARREKRSSLDAPALFSGPLKADPLVASAEAFDGRFIQVTEILVEGDESPSETARNVMRVQGRTNAGVLSSAQSKFG